ncbi:hypothetical protein MRX96_032651 [Rhipicephalus microplus]
MQAKTFPPEKRDYASRGLAKRDGRRAKPRSVDSSLASRNGAGEIYETCRYTRVRRKPSPHDMSCKEAAEGVEEGVFKTREEPAVFCLEVNGGQRSELWLRASALRSRTMMCRRSKRKQKKSENVTCCALSVCTCVCVCEEVCTADNTDAAGILTRVSWRSVGAISKDVLDPGIS